MKPLPKAFWRQILIFNRVSFVAAAMISVACVCGLFFFSDSGILKVLLLLLLTGTLYFTFGSVFFSYLIYDRSDLYKFSVIKKYIRPHDTLFNLYSGYSEGGHRLNEAVAANIVNIDFFDKATAVTGSIRIATARSLPLKNIPVSFDHWEDTGNAGMILFMQSLHELRSIDQKTACLKEAKSHLLTAGKIIVAEHLCDWKNFMIYGPGAFHFFGQKHWLTCFSNASLKVAEEIRVTPFIKFFILEPL